MALSGYFERDEIGGGATAGSFKLLAAAAATVCAFTAVVFLAFPKLDIAIAGLFYLGDGRFVGDALGPRILRDILKLIFIAVSAASAAGVILTVASRRTWLGLDTVRWLFLAVCLVTGPGIVANLALKDEWGRPRPNQIVEFGGSKAFSPVLIPSDQCNRNCSFVSGEASSMYVIFFAVAFLYKRRFKEFAILGAVAGSVAGLVRMSQGAHFLSDVVFAGVVMAASVLAVALLFSTITNAALANRSNPYSPAAGL